VQSFILRRIDYCNVAFAGLPQRSRPIIRLQAVINAAARLVLRLKKFDHISAAIQDELQWLRVGEHIIFKLCILVHKCMNNCAPRYLADKIRPLSDDAIRSRLRSSKSADVFVPATKTKAGDRAFWVAGPRAWNSLSAPIQVTKSLPFKKHFKMHLLRNHEHQHSRWQYTVLLSVVEVGRFQLRYINGRNYNYNYKPNRCRYTIFQLLWIFGPALPPFFWAPTNPIVTSVLSHRVWSTPQVNMLGLYIKTV